MGAGDHLMDSVSITDCMNSGQHLRLRNDQGRCQICGRDEPTEGERYIAEFEADAVAWYGLDLLGHLPGVELDHYLGEHEGSLEVSLLVTLRVSFEKQDEERTLLIDDAPIFFNPTWDKATLIENVARDFEMGEAKARARLQKCGLLPDTSKDGAAK
jgi:hypothetical protein